MLCYYKETFTLGFVSAFFVFAVITIFEDYFRTFLEEAQKNLKDFLLRN